MSDSAKIDKQNQGAACFRCRGFRHACDKNKPSCSRCARRGITCVYPEAAPTLKKLQKATETLGDRIKKFGDRIKAGEMAPLFNIQSAQNDIGSPAYSSSGSSVFSVYSEEEDRPRIKIRRGAKVASTSNFSVYPCTKCFKDLQQCDLLLPRCTRCEANDFECGYKKTEPKANHVSQVLTTMNKVMDQWQDSIDRMAKDFAQKTRDFSVKANNSLKIKSAQTSWKITATQKGISVESNVNSFNDFSALVDQFKRSLFISPKDKHQNNNTNSKQDNRNTDVSSVIDSNLELDDASSIHTTSGFAIWSQWSHPTHALPKDYPIDISQELTDNLVELYCQTPCCSSIRLPIIDTAEFLARYKSSDPTKRPATVLVYAICAMAARNAFQLHVWTKRSSFEAPQYNMGKALSVAYCLRGRELLSECFDEPTLEHCQAAFLLSYCNYQNGFPGVIYIYEWIAFNMAQELGLYQPNRQLSRHEAMLIWCIYYCNAWYRTLQRAENNSSSGISQCKPSCPVPDPLPKPESTGNTSSQQHDQAMVEYYVWNSWVYLIHLQILREESMVRLVAYQQNKATDTTLVQDLIKMQDALRTLRQNLPSEWQKEMASTSCYSPLSVHSDTSNSQTEESGRYCIDLPSFSRYCINLVSLHHSINEIILSQVFVPMDRVPCTSISIQNLQTSLNAANNITQIFETMVQQKEGCHIPLIGFLFANIIYRKLLSYTADDIYYDTGKIGLLRSVEISKASISYIYDFELSRNLIHLMEQDVQYALSKSRTSTETSPSSIPSPTNYMSISPGC
ncbi:hypothetical protein G6F70_002805 [Rhizopus microsporus]|uniref:Zn(2)-C6 fungal-type domain-containing protein n=2 Tax=Rhizopus TaxID=4842 RepID=A0A367J693_RHIAZ|nr:hypothetical protein G6F71_001535 [Rhizopus microsporus]RCH85415.1 hypothetical protein CU097_007549 [Rhizopus azygosporus]KAG1201851.1 hypothetical protein G6F70_002805 [Rhizopus microsporus]KAG1210615.1 hypothetical protein G6F69_005334 [Rhizopus microsporus]KAG1236014.1 hypothetical protein G6F67_002297 [Rhizopus microsporus]